LRPCGGGRRLKQILPDYLIPGFVVILDSLPLTSNRKIDRRALPKPEISQAEGENANGFYPRDDIESVLLDIWKRVLGVRSCGMTDNFFELGGHSLLLVRLGTMIEKEFKKVVPLPFLFEFATIEKVATFLREGTSFGDHASSQKH
jgi:acyl carrier protein